MRSAVEIREEDNTLNMVIWAEDCDSCEDAITQVCKCSSQYKALFDDLMGYFDEAGKFERIVEALADLVRDYIDDVV